MGNSCIKSDKKVNISGKKKFNPVFKKSNQIQCIKHKPNIWCGQSNINDIRKNVHNSSVNEQPFHNSSVNEQPVRHTNIDLNIEKVIINWEAENKTVKYHWWPMLEKKEGDYVNNLFSRLSGLDKYDSLFNTKSIEFQRENYCISIDSDREDKNWAGFCNNASILSCLYEYPKYPVTVCYNKRKLLFTLRDIESLMIVCSDNTIQENIGLFFGERNNEMEGDDKNEPYPSEFLQMLKVLCSQPEPFVMDIDNKDSVWNYAYDKVIVSKNTSCNLDFIAPVAGETIYYNFKITSTAYPNKNQDLWGYINNKVINNGYGTNDMIKINEGWINIKHPDFLWKKFKKYSEWRGQSKINPQINSHLVYRIYLQSLNKENIKLIL